MDRIASRRRRKKLHVADLGAQSMSRHEKLLQQILRGASDGNVRFADLCRLLETMGFTRHIHGSHHIFRHPKVRQRINLQEEGGRAKRYQVRQVRIMLIRSGRTVIQEKDHE